MVKLFEHPLSPYAQKVKLALVEKGIAFQTHVPDLLGGVDPAFFAASPRGEVPALLNGETTVFDSTIILEYLELAAAAESMGGFEMLPKLIEAGRVRARVSRSPAGDDAQRRRPDRPGQYGEGHHPLLDRARVSRAQLDLALRLS